MFQVKDPLCTGVEQDNRRVVGGISQAWQTYSPIVGPEHPKQIQSTQVYLDGLNRVCCSITALI